MRLGRAGKAGPVARLSRLSAHRSGEDRVNDFRLAKDVRPTRYQLHFLLDLERWTFRAEGVISLRLVKPARTITLHSVECDIKTGRDVAEVRYDAESQTATLTLAKELPAGMADLRLDWSREIAAK